MDTPEFLKIGALVKAQHWYGQIDDICISPSRIMLLISSPKGIWRCHRAEWVEYDAQYVTPANHGEAMRDIEIHRKRLVEQVREMDELKEAWNEAKK